MLYMASSQGDIWMEFDMETDTWQLRTMNLPGMRFVHMAKDGEWVWLLPYQGDEIVLWNCVSGEESVIYAEENPNKERGLAPYLFALDVGDDVLVFPQCETDHVLVIPKEGSIAAVRCETGSPAEGLKREDTAAVRKEEPMAESFRGADTAVAHKEEPAAAVVGRQNGARPLPGKEQIRKVAQRIPCGPRDCPSEYRKKTSYGYEFVKRLESGLILAYEYYEGTFLLLDGKLNLIRRVPCRLDIETVRGQQYATWKNAQTRYGYSGRI